MMGGLLRGTPGENNGPTPAGIIGSTSGGLSKLMSKPPLQRPLRLLGNRSKGTSWPSELAKRYFDKVPKMVDEMMTRLDDFLRSKEAFASTKYPKREAAEASKKSTRPINMGEDRFHRGGYGADRRRNEGKGTFNNRDGLVPYQSGKLNHLIKDVRQRGRGNAKGRDIGKDKVINMIRSWPNDKKRKSVKAEESWMKAPIVFSPLSMEDALDEPLIIEAVMEGYLVHRSTQIDLVGFTGGVVKPLRKIKLELVFCDGGLFRTVMINFTIVRTPSPYNVIFGRTGLRSLRAVSSTIHSMVKFPTPRGIATLVTRSAIIFECRMLEKKQMVEKGSGIRQNPGGNQRSGRMGKRKNSSSGEIPYMDIKPGHNEGKQGRIPLDRKRGKGLLRDEKGHSRAVVANYPVKEETLYLPNKDDVERWTIFTDGASNNKGFGAGLVLISPSGVEFTYALRLNFASMNKKTEYEAHLARLHMERKMKVQDIDVKVDSKLVASQINESYEASSTNMIKYLATIKECIAEFKNFAI
nr:reverse transcriptase domain-containing protein [Tanacetum cinerariifolium]